MQIDVSALAPWFAVLLAAASFVYTISTNRSKTNDTKIESMKTWIEAKASKDHVAVLAAKVDVVEDKVTVIENDMKHLPDKDTTHRLEITMEQMRNEMGQLAERVKPISAMASRIQDAILEKAGL